MIHDRATARRALITVMAFVALVILLGSFARAADCPPRVAPADVLDARDH